MKPINIGISITSRYNVGDVRQGAAWMLARARAAAAANLDSLFVGDHHVTPKPYYQNTPMLSRMMADWPVGPAGALYLLPFRHPVLLAQEIATMAALVPDRFIMQCGLGYGEREFNAFGINSKHRPSRFEECLAIMRGLWNGETVSHEGRWQLTEAFINPTPPQPIEVWIAASARVAIDRAARLGDGWLAAPGLTLAKARDDLAYYLERRQVLGKAPGVTAIRRDIYVSETAAEAEAIKEILAVMGYRNFGAEPLVIGTAEQVAAQFAELGQSGFSDIIVRNLNLERDALDIQQAKALESIGRLQQVKAILKDFS